MKLILLLCAFVAVVVCRPDEDYYSTQYDDFDVNEVSGNKRLLKSYCNCFLDEGPCTTEGNYFRKVIPDAVKTKCAKCNDKQKESIRIVVKAIKEKLPELWEKLVKKEDPEGKYKDAFEDFLKGV